MARVEEPAVKPMVAPPPPGVAAPVDRRTQAPPPQQQQQPQQLAPSANPAFARPAPASPGKPEAYLSRPQSFKSAMPEQQPSSHMIPASYGSAPSSNPYAAPPPEMGRPGSGYGGPAAAAPGGGYHDSSSSRPASGYGGGGYGGGYGAPEPGRGGPAGSSAAAAPGFDDEDELLNARNELMESIMEDEEALINSHRCAAAGMGRDGMKWKGCCQRSRGRARFGGGASALQGAAARLQAGRQAHRCAPPTPPDSLPRPARPRRPPRRVQIERTMDIVRAEMNLLTEVDQPGSAIDQYVERLEGILREKAEGIAMMQRRLEDFKTKLREEEIMSRTVGSRGKTRPRY